MILEEFLTTAEENGLYFFSDEYLAQILAVLLVYGGGNEAFVFNNKLNAITKLAQKRFKFDGGETPEEGIILLNKYVKELKQEVVPVWAAAICEKYKLRLK